MIGKNSIAFMKTNQNGVVLYIYIPEERRRREKKKKVKCIYHFPRSNPIEYNRNGAFESIEFGTKPRKRRGGVDIKNVKRGGVQRPMEVTAGVGLVGGLFAGTS